MNRLTNIFAYSFFIIITLLSCNKNETTDSDNELYDDTAYDFVEQYRFPSIEVSSDNPLTQAKVDLGRKLFYDKQLSKSKSTSCGSCHNQANAFTDNGSTVSTNDLGDLTTRNSMPFFNLIWLDEGFFWDGRSASLEDAVDDAINNEQHPVWDVTLADVEVDPDYANDFAKAFEDAEISQTNINKAIASFIKTIVSDDSKFDKYIRGEVALTSLEQYGFDSLFLTEKGDCFHCHGVYPFMTDFDFHDNALQDGGYVDLGLGGITGDTYDEGKMRSPALRNLSYSAPYMHDGRFNTLEEVIDFYSTGQHATPNVDPLMKQVNNGGFQFEEEHILPSGDTINQKEAIIAFLLTLDDETFINNEEYSNPNE